MRMRGGLVILTVLLLAGCACGSGLPSGADGAARTARAEDFVARHAIARDACIAGNVSVRFDAFNRCVDRRLSAGPGTRARY